jgi:hypothetical protein
MALMTVNNHDEQGKVHRSQPRWSAGKKTDAVLRLLRGESLEELSRELKGTVAFGRRVSAASNKVEALPARGL